VDAEYRAINRQRNAAASTKTRLMKIIEDPRSMLALRPGSQVAKRRVRGSPAEPQWLNDRLTCFAQSYAALI